MTRVGGPRKKGQTIEDARRTWTAEQIYRADRTDMITDAELNSALEKGENIKDTYFRLRAKAVISLIRLSGKRRGEIAMIPLDNFKVANDLLNVTFALEKKKRKYKKMPFLQRQKLQSLNLLQEMWFSNLRSPHLV